jgi:dGTPase
MNHLNSVSLQTFVQREAMLLAPYATRSAASQGRKYQEPEHPYRGPYQRDRDRIVHCSAFRRLSGKMQVFTGDMGDYHRTRLTHTFEVASVARTIGRALRLNEDLIEALALFHDIGHPPFGHAGEAALNDCLGDQGGFSHNQYALTIAEELEIRYERFPGLNLTREVLAGQASRANKDAAARMSSLEADVVDVADSITYDAHDADDAVKLGLVSLPELTEIPLMRELARVVQQRSGELDNKSLRKAIVHELIDVQVSDALTSAADSLSLSSNDPTVDLRSLRPTIGIRRDLQMKKQELEQFLFQNVYRHKRLVQVRSQAQRRLALLFRAYVDQPRLLPQRFQQRCEQVGVARSVADYLAGMTDRFCESQFQQLCSERAVG